MNKLEKIGWVLITVLLLAWCLFVSWMQDEQARKIELLRKGAQYLHGALFDPITDSTPTLNEEVQKYILQKESVPSEKR